MSISKSRSVLFSILIESFEAIGGVPKKVMTPNMETIIGDGRTKHLYKRFTQFAEDFRFKVHPCIAGRLRTKGRIESTMNHLDESHAYQGKVSLEEFGERSGK